MGHRFTVMLAALCVALAGCSSLPPPAGTLPTGAAFGDQVLSPFYVWEGPRPARPGVMLRSEPLPAQAEVAASVASVSRILYSTEDARWRSGVVAASGTLFLPKGAPPQGGWPVVAWAHGTLGIADRCAPSWAGHAPRDATYIARWLQAGYAVVAADYQGLGTAGPHPYLAWQAEGRSVLDAVRAALAAHAGTLANDVVITGQSQGSGASLGAARIASAYAPELKLRAVIATGLVSTFPDGPVKLEPFVPTRGSPAVFLILGLAGGWMRDDGAAPESLLTDQGRRLLAAARETCAREVNMLARQEGIDVLAALSVDLDKVRAALRPASDMDLAVLPAPVFLGTGLADRTIVPARQYRAAMALCAAGNAAVWKTYPGVTHNGGVNAAFDDELAFVQAARAGRPVASNCGTFAEPGAPQAATPGTPFND